MTEMQMYWITRLDTFVEMFEIMTAFSVAGFIIAFLTFVLSGIFKKFDNDFEGADKVNKAIRLPLLIVLVVMIISISGRVFTPTTKQMAAIIVVPKIVNNKEAKQLPENLLALCNEWAKSQIVTLQEKENENSK